MKTKSVYLPNFWHIAETKIETLCGEGIPPEAEIKDGAPEEYIYYADEECLDCFMKNKWISKVME